MTNHAIKIQKTLFISTIVLTLGQLTRKENNIYPISSHHKKGVYTCPSTDLTCSMHQHCSQYLPYIAASPCGADKLQSIQEVPY